MYAIINHIGPKGDPGDRGPSGPKGEPGKYTEIIHDHTYMRRYIVYIELLQH